MWGIIGVVYDDDDDVFQLRPRLDSPQMGCPFNLAPSPELWFRSFETYQIASVLLRFKRPIQI